MVQFSEDDQIARFLAFLTEQGVADWTLRLIRADLRYRDNERLLLEQVQRRIVEPAQVALTRRALEVARKAHEGQTQKRPQDAEGLSCVPYLNHVVQVARLALAHDVSPEGVQAALMHDVVEDTPLSLEDLAQLGFSQVTVSLVDDCSRHPGESRKAFLERVNALTGEALLIKCFDRYQNIVRSFSLRDPAYFKRIIRETEHYYLPHFLTVPALNDLAPTCKNLLDELGRFSDKIEQIQQS